MLDKPSHYHNLARDSLAKAHKPGRVILIHTGAVLLLSLILILLDHLLDQQIGNTGGLGGMDQRSVLVTIQSVLRLGQMLLLPFWQIGYTYYTLRLARNQSADVPDLLEGFRRFGPVLRLRFLIMAIFMALLFASAYVGSFLFSLSPFSNSMMAEMELLTASGLKDAALADAFIALAWKPQNLIPILVFFGIFFLAGGYFLFFRFRMAELWLMDHPGCGALAALHFSRMIMRGNWKGMLRLDLSFWWFYLLELAVAVLGFGDLILDAMGIELTTNAFGSYLLFFCLYLWAHMTLYWWKRNQVCTAYAHAYVAICPVETQQEPQQI